ncbi:probable pyridoxal 5'-phosphate synthase subunit pdx2 [Actinia tenebrosa]|uniref:glutaminase n=1 Tax=Actinia tenebrosa TaxID=6105 RepID=A0A6P8HBG4_ACTTE|nr:probable pyridoxal 5'-phosphate synthase subunit pdx2 [Actinia tenebrosa]
MANDKDPVNLKVGVLAIQGGFFEHKAALLKALKNHKFKNDIEVQIVEVREEEDLQELDGLILPGGESTTMSIFLESSGLDSVLKDWMNDKTKPRVVWGTCAGLILMSNQIAGQKEGGQAKIGGLDITTSRNFFGRQLNSFEAVLDIKDKSVQESILNSTVYKSTCKGIHGVFIRAPAVLSIDSKEVQILATVKIPSCERPVIVAVAQDNLMATAFHPELTDDVEWHAYFIRKILNA